MSDLKAISLPEWEGNARVIYAPETLVEAGFSQEAVDACTEIMESNLSDPTQTIYGNDGKPVTQMRGVVLYDIAAWIARKHKLKLDWARGLNTTLDRIQEAARLQLEGEVAR